MEAWWSTWLVSHRRLSPAAGRGPGLRVIGVGLLAIAPGGIETEGTRGQTLQQQRAGIDLEQTRAHFLATIPLGRTGEPDDIARVALFLVSDTAAYMTGTLVVVDGGVRLA